MNHRWDFVNYSTNSWNSRIPWNPWVKLNIELLVIEKQNLQLCVLTSFQIKTTGLSHIICVVLGVPSTSHGIFSLRSIVSFSIDLIQSYETGAWASVSAGICFGATYSRQWDVFGFAELWNPGYITEDTGVNATEIHILEDIFEEWTKRK